MGAINFAGLGACVSALLGRRSLAYEAFRLSFLGATPQLAEALDLVALAKLAGRERRLAERMLMAALPEPRAIDGLAALATPRARRRLRALFEAERANLAADPGTGGGALIAAAAALWRLSPDDRYARAVFVRLREAASGIERAEAALALARMPTAQAESALTAALDDDDALTRHCAARALLDYHGVCIDPRAARCIVLRAFARYGAPRSLDAAAILDLPAR